jgi:hypothetical protein
MTDTRPDRDAQDAFDEALRELKAARSLGIPGVGLEARILTRVGETRQRRRLAFIPGSWSGFWPSTSGPARVVALGSIGVAAVLVAALVGTVVLAPRAATETPGAGSSPATSPGPTDASASNPPHVGGTCPLTPLTRLAGGSAPEVDVSGLRWRWGGVPWVAGAPEKVAWLADNAGGPEPRISAYAIQLDLPILVDGRPVNFVGAAGSAIYAITTDTGVDLLRLPSAGCWLLTAVWSQGASSVVVAAAPPTATASPVPSTRGPTVPSTQLAMCPATSPSPLPPPQGWPGPAYVDGPFRWLLPPSQTWRIGAEGDKLVLDSGLGWGAGDKRVIAFPLAQAAGIGRLRGTAVTGDTPGISGGTMGVGITLPARDCWAFVYLDAGATSTIVDDLRP